MATVGDVIDRLFREWLHPAFHSPLVVSLDGALDASQTDVTLDDSMLSPKERNALAPGLVIEVGQEQMLIVSYDLDTKIATVRRGYNATDATAHSDDDLTVLTPQYARRVAFDAIADEIVNLHPTLWGEETDSFTVTAGEAQEVDSNIVGVAAVTYIDTNDTPKSGTARLLRNYPPVSSNRAVLVGGVPDGKTVYLTLKTDFTRPTAEDDDLSDLNVKEDWINILVVGAASRMIPFIDVSRVEINWMTELDQVNANPAGTTTSLASRIKAYRDDLLEEASRRQSLEYPAVITWNDPFRPSTRV